MIKVPMSAAMNKVTLNVKIKGMGSHKIRVWIAIRLLKLASTILRCRMSMNFNGEQKQ